MLIAEDDARVLRTAADRVHPEHFRVVTARDGDEAIRRAIAERPDLVVLDVQMPRKNGFEVCDWLRHDPEDPQVPIVFVSASADTEVRIEGLARGADDFLSKPFSPRELVARGRRLLARSARGAHAPPPHRHARARTGPGAGGDPSRAPRPHAGAPAARDLGRQRAAS